MKKPILSALALAIVLICGCNKDKIRYDVPATYNFSGVDISAQATQMKMLDEMVAYAEGARVPGTVLDAQHLKDMFHNQNAPFSFSSTEKLSDFTTRQEILEAWMDSLENASRSTTMATHGVAGLSVSSDGADTFLLDAKGIDYTEYLEKGVMNATFFNQTVNLFSTVLFTTLAPSLEAQWDHAYGYTGIPLDYPANTSAAQYWGDAFGEVNALTKTLDSLFAATVLGRAAIVNEDWDRVEAQATLIRRLWEKGAAAMAIHELNEAKTHLGDDALRNHEISECLGYLRALGTNPTHKISDAQQQALFASFGNDLYVITLPTIDNARSTLAAIYGFDNIKDQL